MKTKSPIPLLLALSMGLGFVVLRQVSPRGSDRGADAARETSSAAMPPEQATGAPLPLSQNTHRDRTKRDAIRDALLRAFSDSGGGTERVPTGSAAPGGTTRAPSSPTFRTASSDEEYGKFIQERVREDMFPLAKSCYENLLQIQPDAGGRLVLSFELISDEALGGVVNNAVVDESSTLRNKDFDECITESLSSIYFDHPQAKGRTTVKYPIVFATGPAPDE